MKHIVIPVTPFQQNCALTWNEETMQGAVTDPGGDAAAITAAVTAHGVKVTAIYLTHGHLDHAGGAIEMAASLRAPIIGPGIKDKFLLEGIAAQTTNFGFRAQDCTPTSYLTEREQIDIGGTKFDVLHPDDFAFICGHGGGSSIGAERRNNPFL